jgi:hypothetical protein
VVSAEEDSTVLPLRPWDPGFEVVAPSGDVFSDAAKNRCSGIVLPWSLSELEKRGPSKGNLPVFYPLIGLSDAEVKNLQDRIQT